jgi:polyhydroxyalkanoate synthase
MRKGPHPLSVQISLAASAPEMGKADFTARPPLETAEEIKNMLLGIQKYQTHPYHPKRGKLETVWEAGAASVSTIPGHAAKKDSPAILLVPSMVNRAYILDLVPERSMLRWLGEQGVTPYLLEWGEGVEDDGQQSIDDIVLQRLVPAIEFVAQKHSGKTCVLGYCMGGTLLAGAAQNAAQFISSLIFLAAPWDFHAGTRTMLSQVQFWAPSAFPAIVEKGHLPMDWMQVLFASLAPGSAAKKFASFADMDQDSDEARLFVAVEDWLNDGVDLPGPVAQQCIKEWFFENATAAGKWQVGGEAVNPSKLAVPTLVITSKRDRLVDYDTAVSVSAGIKRKKVIDTGTGHIGMIAGSGAVEKVWAPIADWVKKNAP